MNSYKMLSASRAASATIGNAVHLIELIRDLAEMSDRAYEVSGAHALSNLSSNSDIRKFANEIGGKLKNTSIVLVIEEMSLLKISISTLQETLNFQSKNTFMMIEEISDFSSSFQKALQGYKLDNLLSLVHAAKTFQSTLAVFSSSLNLFSHSIHPTYSLPDEYDQISIFLDSNNPSLDDILRKISAIKSLYLELLSLLDISETDYPLQVLKVESGSFWIWLAGRDSVVSWIKEIIERAISFGYRNFTNEGKMVEGIPQRLRVLEQVIQVKETMKASGCDTSVSDDLLNKSLIRISKRFEDLIGDADNIEIDMESYSPSSRTSNQNLLNSIDSRLPLLGSVSHLDADDSDHPN